MSYTIVNRRDQITVITTVEFTLSDGSTKIIDIPHFMPKDEADIIRGIQNREITENNNLNVVSEE